MNKDDEAPPVTRTLETAETLSDIGEGAWSALLGTSKKPGRAYNPFVSYAFLSALEDSGSAEAETGWIGSHILVKDQDGTIDAALPAYLKMHSYGEYVFDHAWVDAYERAGGRYYPKLQSSIPFTPASAPKLLVSASADHDAMRTLLARGTQAVVEKLELSSAHITFVDEGEAEALEEHGFLRRHDQQFHWNNNSYESFDAFTQELASRKRKQIRKERREALETGIEIEWVTGSDLTEAHWDAFFVFYQDTGARKWGQPYLTRQFFSLIGERMADDVLLIMAKRDGNYIAGALNFIGSDALYGRNWGCSEHHPFLHFEVCYYQAIDYAIAHGLARVEAGAQGSHKLARGYTPAITTSMHYIPNPSFRQAVADYLVGEREQVMFDTQYLEQRTPFRKSGGQTTDYE
ncbi:MAG: GNAT family N-acetyltransferase [Devosiaceae bacterium]